MIQIWTSSFGDDAAQIHLNSVSGISRYLSSFPQTLQLSGMITTISCMSTQLNGEITRFNFYQLFTFENVFSFIVNTKHQTTKKCCCYSYSDNQKTVKYEDNIKAIPERIWCLGLFTLHIYWASLDYLSHKLSLNVYFLFQSISCYHCFKVLDNS